MIIMIFIKDLGLTTLDGKLVKPRLYYKVKCPQCNTVSVVRTDCFDSAKVCSSCTRKNTNKAAELILQLGKKECSICNKILPLHKFGTKTSTLTSLRYSCKECEKVATAGATLAYKQRTKAAKAAYDLEYSKRPYVKERSKLLSLK